MPIYDYICPNCAHRGEVMHGVNDDSQRPCPNCATPMRKAFAPPAIMFKGTGWAKMDRRSASAAKKSSDADGAAVGSKGSGGSDGGSDGGSSASSGGDAGGSSSGNASSDSGSGGTGSKSGGGSSGSGGSGSGGSSGGGSKAGD